MDESGVSLGRGATLKRVPWEKITGAALLHERLTFDQDDRQKGERIAELLGGPDVLARVKALEGRMAKVVLAYRDDQDKRAQMEVPIPLDEPAFRNEFQSRLGSRWLGEVANEHEAEKELHTAPGFFSTVFVLFVLFGIVGAIGLLAIFSLLGQRSGG